MAHIGAQLSPFRVGRTVGELDQVEGIVDVRLQILGIAGRVGFLIVPILVLASHTYIQYGKRSRADFLAQQEVFIESQTIALEIVRIVTVGKGRFPTVLVERSIFHRPYGMLPLVARFQIGTFYDTAAGETEHARTHVV